MGVLYDVCTMRTEPEISVFILSTSREGSGESAHMHMRRVARAFTAHIDNV